jgi:hypothetical protein
VSFQLENTLAGYARAAVDLKTRMWEFTQTRTGRDYIHAFTAARLAKATAAFPDQAPPQQPCGTGADEVVEVMDRLTSLPWRHGEPYVLAPAMTAVVAAAADALDLTGDRLPADAAPAELGVLFLPEPVYHRRPDGTVAGIGAITWAKYTADGAAAWAVGGWVDRTDPHDPAAAHTHTRLARAPVLASRLGPYILSDFDRIPIGQPVDPRPGLPTTEEADTDWQPAPDGRYCIEECAARTAACTRLAYAFWRIHTQPLATLAHPPLDRPARRRAARASIVHDTRVVMLRRLTPTTEPTGGEAKWHYRVRFVVRGHWRRLRDRDGNPYRIWVNAYVKGPDGAPLLAGEKVAILAR